MSLISLTSLHTATGRDLPPAILQTVQTTKLADALWRFGRTKFKEKTWWIVRAQQHLAPQTWVAYGTRLGYPLRARLPCGRSRGAVHKADAAGSVPRHWPGYFSPVARSTASGSLFLQHNHISVIFRLEKCPPPPTNSQFLVGKQ